MGDVSPFTLDVMKALGKRSTAAHTGLSDDATAALGYLKQLVDASPSGTALVGTCDSAVGSTTDVYCTGLIGFGDNYFNDSYYMMVLATDNAAAPQGELRDITDYVSTTGKFICSAFSANVEADDELLVIHKSLAALLYMYFIADGTGAYPASLANDSTLAKMMCKGATATPSTFDNATDSLEMLSDKLGGFSGDGGANQDDSVKASLDLAHTDLDSIITKLAKPAADATTDATIAEVVGIKADAAQTTVGTQRSLMGYLKGALNELAKVPKSDSTVSWNATALAAINTEVKMAMRSIGMQVLATGTFTTESATVPADTSRTEATGYWNRCWLVPTAGTEANMPRQIASFAGGVFTMITGSTWISAPSGAYEIWANGTGLNVLALGTFTTSSTSVPADVRRGEVANYWNGNQLVPLSGAAGNQARNVGLFTQGTGAAGGVFSLNSGALFTTAPGTVTYAITRGTQDQVAVTDSTSTLSFKSTIGNKADAAVTTVGLTASIIAYIKGILNQLAHATYGLSAIQSLITRINARLSTGVDYYVNGDVGSSGAGTTWATAFKTVAEAITASEASRGSTMIRNRIFIQGISTAYAAITALPNWCDIIGVGANPSGNGSGIARINGASAADAVSSSVQTRGNKFYNLQFATGGAYWCFDSAGLLRTEFHDCVFLNDAAAADGGIRITGNSGGVLFDNCHCLSDSGWMKVGLHLNGAITFNSSRLRKSTFAGTTAGILIDAGCYDHNTIVEDCVIGDIGGGCAKGIDDNTTTGWMTIADSNTIIATIPVERTVNTRTTPGDRKAGVIQIFEKAITSAANAGAVTVATITTQPCLVKVVVEKAVTAAQTDLTSAAITGGGAAGTTLTFINATDAAKANIDAVDEQVAWTGAVELAATKTIVITLVGGGATPVDLLVTIEYEACADGGYLA